MHTLLNEQIEKVKVINNIKKKKEKQGHLKAGNTRPNTYRMHAPRHHFKLNIKLRLTMKNTELEGKTNKISN